MQNFSNPILAARTEAGKTQAEFAEMLGISRNYLWMLECGRKPVTPKMLAKVNAVLSEKSEKERLQEDGDKLDRILTLLERIALALEKLAPK